MTKTIPTSSDIECKRRLQSLNGQMGLFLEYLDRTEAFIDAEIQKQIQARVKVETELAQTEEKLPQVSPDNADVWDMRHHEIPPKIEALMYDLQIIDEVELPLVKEFADMIRKSFFVNLYSYLESQLLNECKIRQQARDDILLTLRDVSGKGIFLAKTYLVKVLRVDMPFRSPEWCEIQNYNKLRNCIVHNEGELESFHDREALAKYIETKGTLTFGGRQGIIVFDRGFCEESTHTIRSFLEATIRA